VEGCFNGVWGDESNGVDDLVVVRVADFDREKASVELGDSPTVRAIPESARSRRVLRRGDLLIEKSGGGEQQPVGNVVLFDDARAAVCSNFVARLPVANWCDSRYVAYVFRAMYLENRNIPHIKQTSGIQNLDSESYLNELAWLPHRNVQERIANFLDEKTARIDALIAEKERLTKLLLEEEQSCIDGAVLGGQAPLSHFPFTPPTCAVHGVVWRRVALKRCWQVTDCKHLTVDFVEDGFPLASIREVSGSVLELCNAKRARQEDYLNLIEGGRQPRRGDLIYARNASVGAAAYVDTDEPFAMGQDVCLISSADQDQRFLRLQLMSSPVKAQLEGLLVGATIRRINVEQLRNFVVLVPPPDVQREVVQAAEAQLARRAELRAHLAEHINVLREYRSSLISAAVTGQLNIYDFKARPLEAA
jgi:type I restriction enzyme S subunit